MLYTKTLQILRSKKISMPTGLKNNLWHVSVHFTDRNTMQIGDLMELNLEVLEMQKLNISVDRAE